jgi:hypothetical protein
MPLHKENNRYSVFDMDDSSLSLGSTTRGYSTTPSTAEHSTTPGTEEFPMIVVPYDDDEIRSPQLHFKLFHQPLSPEVHISMRLGTMLRRYHWDETWMGLLPARIGHNRSLDLAVSAYLEPQKLNSVENLMAGIDSMQLYTEAIDSVQTTMNEPSFWTSEDVQLTVGVLSAYESIKGASMAYMYVFVNRAIDTAKSLPGSLTDKDLRHFWHAATTPRKQSVQ